MKYLKNKKKKKKKLTKIRTRVTSGAFRKFEYLGSLESLEI